MKSIKILHTADLHLDSAFEALSAGKAAIRRTEQRQLLSRLAELAIREQVDLVLMPGDLLDSDHTYYETGEDLIRCLSQIPAPVVIAPGNHDYYSRKSPYAALEFPRNVSVFRSSDIQRVEPEGIPAIVYGAAFTDRHSDALLKDFHAERKDGYYNLLCIHGEVTPGRSVYNPITEAQLSASGIDYAALGHIHSSEGLKKAGSTWYSQSGCPEGRGFDETGEKTVSLVTLREDGYELETRCIASRRYETLEVDVTASDPLLAIHTMLPDDTAADIYRIILTGETGQSPDLARLYDNLSEMFFELQLRDETRLRQSVWERAGEDTLRGLFLLRLREKYDTARDDSQKLLIEQAARWGLAALDNREEVVRHEDQ